MSFSIPKPPRHADRPFVDRLALLPIEFRHPDILFVVRRTMNENLCVYQLNRSRTHHQLLDAKEPVLAYWVDRKGPEHWERANLTLLERKMGYGIDVVDLKSSLQEVVFSIRAVRGRNITARLKNNEPRPRSIAFTHINHELSKVHSVDIHMSQISAFRMLNPANWTKVIKYISINGYSESGALQQEVISNQ